MAIDMTLDLTPKEKIARAKIGLYQKSPFFCYLVDHIKFSENNQMPTMGVSPDSKCIYNSKFILSLDDNTMMGTLCHEVMHLALHHTTRIGNRKIMINNMSLWNIAADIIVNNIVLNNDFSLPENGIIPKDDSIVIFNCKIDKISKKSVEEIYELLKDAIKQHIQKQKGNGAQDKDGNYYVSDFGNEFGFDEHEDWGKDGKEENKVPGKEDKDAENCTDKNNWDKILADAYNHSKLIGTYPAGLGREFDELKKSKINWRSLLRKTVAKNIPYNYTWNKPNKKIIGVFSDVYLPTTTGEEINILVSIDTSGSISKKDLSVFISEIIGISKSFSSVSFRLLTHDIDVHDDLLFTDRNINKIKNVKISGGGGTTHKKLYKYISKQKYSKTTKILVSFTDGYSEYPKTKPDISTIFVLSGDHIITKDMPNWGKVIPMEN